MQVCNRKSVGARYQATMRRRTIQSGASITFDYWFMPFRNFGAFDGMEKDLAGGFLLGETADAANNITQDKFGLTFLT